MKTLFRELGLQPFSLAISDGNKLNIMNSEQIQNFLDKNVDNRNKYVKIQFQKRDSLHGLFLTEARDFKEMSAKNFWRIVTQKNLDDYSVSKDLSLSRLFNGSEITRLSVSNEF